MNIFKYEKHTYYDLQMMCKPAAHVPLKALVRLAICGISVKVETTFAQVIANMNPCK